MGAIMAMCVSSQLLQGAANPWLYKHVRLDVSKPHQVTGFTSGITSDKTGYIRTLDIAPDSRVTGTMPSRMLERLDLKLQRSFQHFQALEILTVYSPLCGRNKDFLEPRVNLRYVYALAVQLRSPRLRKVTLNVGLEAIPTQSNLNEDIKWESEHRLVWHIEYPHDDDGYARIKVWESLHQEKQSRIEEVEG